MSNIEWTDITWNPGIYGCTEVSPACANCYAAKMAHRLVGMGVYPHGITAKRASGIHWSGVVSTEATNWVRFSAAKRLPKRKPARVFVTSMSDLFHHDVPDEFIGAVFDEMRDRPHLTFQVLTKRPERMAEWSARMEWDGYAYAGTDRHRHWWWPENVWAGTTIEDQKRADERLPWMYKVRAPVRFLSCEPLLGPIVLPPIATARIDWVITGCESMGGKRPGRPTDVEWVRSLRDQCSEAGAAFFLKQLAQGGRVVAQPELDGRQWLEFPEIPRAREVAA